jgi:hypothetical protein
MKLEALDLAVAHTSIYRSGEVLLLGPVCFVDLKIWVLNMFKYLKKNSFPIKEIIIGYFTLFNKFVPLSPNNVFLD